MNGRRGGGGREERGQKRRRDRGVRGKGEVGVDDVQICFYPPPTAKSKMEQWK